MLHRTFIVLAAAALATLYSCSRDDVDTAEQAALIGSDAGAPDASIDASPAPDAGSGAGSGSGSGSGQQIRFSVSHSASNMRDESAANARLDLLLGDDPGGLAVLGYSGCAVDPATVSRSTYTSLAPISYSGDSSSGTFYTLLAHGFLSAAIVCASGPIPPPDTGAGSDTSSDGPVSDVIYDEPPPP
jgi:hypothetical protein